MIRLTPRPSSKPIDLATFRLLTEDVFSEVTVDADEGESQKALHLMTLRRIGAPSELVERRAALDAAMITIGDSEVGEVGYVSFLYFPGEEIIIGFSGSTHAEHGGIVAAKLAVELGYDLSHQ